MPNTIEIKKLVVTLQVKMISMESAEDKVKLTGECKNRGPFT
jgi:hypothetical protein